MNLESSVYMHPGIMLSFRIRAFIGCNVRMGVKTFCFVAACMHVQALVNSVVCTSLSSPLNALSEYIIESYESYDT